MALKVDAAEEVEEALKDRAVCLTNDALVSTDTTNIGGLEGRDGCAEKVGRRPIDAVVDEDCQWCLD